MRWFGVASAIAVLALPLSARADLLVHISKSQQRMAVIIDGTETYRWPVSTGRRGFETPAGTFHPTRLERHWYSRIYDRTPMPWSVFFYRGYAMHGTMEAYNLGNAVSHGCVRLRPDNASILFALVRKRGYDKTKVVVTNGPLPLTPAAETMADAKKRDTSNDFAKAFRDDRARSRERDDNRAKEKDKKKESRVKELAAKPDVKELSAKKSDPKVMHAEVRRDVSRGDERSVLREREAWLRSLDRKYGIR
jgi:hypothetical protein